MFRLFCVILAIGLSLPAAFCRAGNFVQDQPTLLASVNLKRETSIRGPDWVRMIKAARPLDLILVEKDTQHLKLLSYDGEFRVLATYPCATGENDGRKVESGDSRTPEGIYFITKSYTDSRITVFGNRAFHLDYPNLYDRKAGRNGTGIYIHGTNRQLTPTSTNGCITMRNKDLERLSSYLRQDEIPVVIVPSSKVLSRAGFKLMEISDAQALAMLVPEEIRAENEVEIQQLFLLSDGSQAVAIGRFLLHRQDYASAESFSRTYMTYEMKQGWTAAEQLWQASPSVIEPVARLKVAVRGKIASSEEVLEYPKNEGQVIDFVEKWRQAWQNKELQQYIDCYAESFTDGRRNLTAWKRYKARLNRQYASISVNIDAVAVHWSPSGASVSFHQIYDSDRYHAEGHKTLELAYGDTGWQILREIWSQ